eukprot:5787686-Pyramimonas_sp.AAC.1
MLHLPPCASYRLPYRHPCSAFPRPLPPLRSAPSDAGGSVATPRSELSGMGRCVAATTAETAQASPGRGGEAAKEE